MINRFLIHQGQLLRDLRLARGMTLRKASAEAYIALGYLSEVERGMKSPHPDTVSDLCAAYGVSHADLLRSVADMMDLHGEDMVHWRDEEHRTAVPGVCAGSPARA